ncbi:hypothetical protein [Perigonia lusca single nucleopolyhedrovirus]|uniref:Uncharacterized protein n=1 Tax=Perigonia lusca single nucleopolyhedrovirus TaxID=1675865 RepID=A0A0M3WN22_9ABAC|nr:hypothetical protein [Perigonia lusca single nucleopolyhedrovirus]AKN80617.1 hypothetical protein [Perigonia lusca single nucleopolyhedrovirus]
MYENDPNVNRNAGEAETAYTYKVPKPHGYNAPPLPSQQYESDSDDCTIVDTDPNLIVKPKQQYNVCRNSYVMPANEHAIIIKKLKNTKSYKNVTTYRSTMIPFSKIIYINTRPCLKNVFRKLNRHLLHYLKNVQVQN